MQGAGVGGDDAAAGDGPPVGCMCDECSGWLCRLLRLQRPRTPLQLPLPLACGT